MELANMDIVKLLFYTKTAARFQHSETYINFLAIRTLSDRKHKTEGTSLTCSLALSPHTTIMSFNQVLDNS